jgi:hypothetical protein
VNELVLVVEDDPAVLKLTVGMLSELGYRTLAAESAAKALELLDANADVRLLLTRHRDARHERSSTGGGGGQTPAGLGRHCSPPAIRATPSSTTARSIRMSN